MENNKESKIGMLTDTRTLIVDETEDSFIVVPTDLREREKHVRKVSNILNKNGKYLSVSFNDQSKAWGKGKLRTPPDTKTPLYMASQEELTDLFNPHFKILDKKLIRLPERNNAHLIGNYFLMKAK